MRELTRHIKENNWYKQAANVKLYYLYTPWRAAIFCSRSKLGFWSLRNMKYLEAFYVEEQFNNHAAESITKQLKNPDFIGKLLDNCANWSRKLNGLYLELEQKKYLMDDKEVYNYLKKLDSINYEYWKHAYFCDVYDPKGEAMLDKFLLNKSIRLSQEEKDIMLRNSSMNYTQKERLSLLNLCKNKANSNFTELMGNHVTEFFYVLNSWENTSILKKEHVIKLLEELDIVEEEKLLKTNWKLEQDKIIAKRKLDIDAINILHFFRMLFKLRDDRKQHTLISNHYYDELFRMLSKSLSIPFDDMSVLTVGDIIGLFRKEKENVREDVLSIIKTRMNLVAGYYDGSYIILNEKDSNNVYNNLQRYTASIGASVRGNPANKGKAKGIVRVIQGETHFSKFNDGEIIVASMTRPEYVPLMKRALAIITDEGGITCHAAIVSREIGIPCIVGTREATVKLKDGMYVEVNANRGIVRVLKHFHMYSVQELVNDELIKLKITDYGIINLSALAKKIKSKIENKMRKALKLTAISMAIRRYIEASKKYSRPQ